MYAHCSEWAAPLIIDTASYCRTGNGPSNVSCFRACTLIFIILEDEILYKIWISGARLPWYHFRRGASPDDLETSRMVDPWVAVDKFGVNNECYLQSVCDTYTYVEQYFWYTSFFDTQCILKGHFASAWSQGYNPLSSLSVFSIWVIRPFLLYVDIEESLESYSPDYH